MSTYRDLVNDSLHELQVLDAEETAGAADGVLALRRLNAIFDRFNAIGIAAYVDQWTIYTGFAALAPHTIGPSGSIPTFTARPERIMAANLRASTSLLSTRTQITLRDEAWWNAQTVPGTSGTPTDLFYRPTWPDGELNFYPVPDATFYPEFLVRQQYASGTLDTEFSLPPGYESAMMKMLAIELAPAYGVEPSATTIRGAAVALNQILSNHSKVHYSLPDSSMPGSNLGYFDITTRQYR